MKWKNRLQAVLSQNAKTQNSKECLEMELRKAAKASNFLVSAVNSSSKFRYLLGNNQELADFKNEKLHEVLNRLIESGIKFDVSANDFQIIDEMQTLKNSDKEFLNLNDGAVLCQLQQSLLMKHLFSHSPELLENFAFEVLERETTLTETDVTDYGLYCSVVMDVTRNWFEWLLDKQAFWFSTNKKILITTRE